MSSPQASRKELIRQKDEALLASLGYKQEFKRAFTPLEVFGIAFSIIGLLPSIGSVLFYAVQDGGGPSMVWGWLAGSIFILFIGMAMADLASAAPTSGGLYWWTYSLSSPRWRKVLCWTVGCECLRDFPDANTIGNVAAVASVDWGWTQQVMVAVNIGSGSDFEPTPAQLFGAYTGIVLSHIAVCCLGTAILARLQRLYILLNVVLCLVVIIALPAVTPNTFKNSANFALWDFSNDSGWSNGFAFILSLMSPCWTIGAFDSSVHISEEASNAAIAVPWAIVSAVGIAGVLGWAINMALAFCMGTDLDTLRATSQPMAVIFVNSFGEKATLAIWAFIVLGQYMMGSSMLLACSRQTFAFSRDSALPFSGWLYRINKTTGTPVNAVIFGGVLSILLGLLVFAGSQAVNAVFALSTVGLYFAYSVPIAARFMGRNDELKPGPFSLGILSLPVAAIAVLFMTFVSIVFLFPSSPNPDVGTMNYTVIVFGGVMVLSLVWYYFPRYGGVYWFTGPVRTIDGPATMVAESDDIFIQEDEKAQEIEL